MQRVLRHRLLAILLAFLSLTAAAILPIGGVASAAATSAACPSGEEGSQCLLVISAPDSVAVGQPFTVNVTILQYAGEGYAPIAKSDCASKVVVSLDVFQIEGPVTTYSAKAAAGTATFSVTVPGSGTWDLDAYVAVGEGSSNCGSFDDGFAQLTAVDVPAGQPIAPCPPDVSCLQITSGSGSAATLFADSGMFTASFGALVAGEGCGTLQPADPNGVLTYALDETVPKTIVFALSSALITKGIGQYNICWRSDNPFTQLGGTPAPPIGGSFTGLLPDCKNNDAGPCVLFKTSDQHNVGFFGVRAPPGDPKGYPG